MPSLKSTLTHLPVLVYLVAVMLSSFPVYADGPVDDAKAALADAKTARDSAQSFLNQAQSASTAAQAQGYANQAQAAANAKKAEEALAAAAEALADFQETTTTQVQQIASQGQKQTSNLVKQRIATISKDIRSQRVRRQAPQTAYAPQSKGQNAGDDEPPLYGVWSNLALTRSEDLSDNRRVVSTQGSILAGADMALTDSLIVGGALNVETALVNDKFSEFKVHSSAIGMTPYLSLSLNDVISLSALGNLTYGSALSSGSDPNEATQIIKTRFNSLRWDIATQADAFLVSGNFGLLSSIGLNYGQNHQFSTQDSQDNHMDGQTSRSGAINLSLLPSYYVTIDDDFALEPYVIGQYSYSYKFKKADPANAKGENQYRVGAGLNVFSGDSVSGNLEASTAVGQRKYRETTLSGNIRINF